MNKRATADVLVLLFTAMIILIIISTILIIQSGLNDKYKESIKEEFSQFDANHLLLAYSRSTYQGKPIFEILTSLNKSQESEIEKYSRIFFKDLPNYWQIYFTKSSETFILDSEGEKYNYERYAAISTVPSATLILPSSTKEDIVIRFYYHKENKNVY